MSDSISIKETSASQEKDTVSINVFETYMATIKKSTGAKIFQNLYASINGKNKDIAENGSLSCARYASAILVMTGLIKGLHATVEGTVKDIENSGWKKIQKPRKGAVLVWEPGPQSNWHPHIGFYIGKDKAISNSTKKRVPARHHWTYGTTEDGKPKRKVASIWWHDKLDG